MPLAEIHRYPVKSCRGESLTTAVVEPWGLAGDRRWMLVDPDGRAITAREVNRMLLLHPGITETGLRVTGPGLAPLDVATPDAADLVPVSVWGSSLVAAAAGAEADAWFSDAMGLAARLVWLDDPTRRPSDPTYSRDDDRVSFADGYPLLLTSRESLAALDDALLERTEGRHEPVPMERFRSNLVVTGAEAWAEDDWRVVRVGGATFRAVKGCARCVITTIDPDTAARGKEPTATLARTRRYDGGVWFGVNLVPDDPGATLRVGDEVEVLEAVTAGSGPLRQSTVGTARS